MQRDRRALQSELADLAALRIVCDDCGHQLRWHRSRIAEAEKRGYRSLLTLGTRFRCRVCAERGGSGKNVSVIPIVR